MLSYFCTPQYSVFLSAKTPQVSSQAIYQLKKKTTAPAAETESEEPGVISNEQIEIENVIDQNDAGADLLPNADASVSSFQEAKVNPAFEEHPEVINQPDVHDEPPGSNTANSGHGGNRPGEGIHF